MAGLTRPVSIGPQRTDIVGPPEPWRDLFERQRHFACPDMFDPAFLPVLMARCDQAHFVRDDVIGTSEVETPRRVGMMLNLLLTRAPFLRWVEAATGCPPLIRCEGRVDRLRAEDGHEIVWHDDNDLSERALAIVINLSGTAFAGGEFQLRRKGGTELLADYRHERDGTALLFDVDPALEHRVLPVTAGGPRRVFAGWFIAAGAGRPPLDVIG